MKEFNYYEEVHTFGKYSNLTAVGLMFLVPIVMMLYFDVSIDVGATFAAALQLCIVFIPTNFIEVVSFSPILGSGGTYLSFITGNVMNMKVPAAAAGHRLAEVEPHSDEGEVISVLAIGMSSITTTIIVFAGMFLLAPLIPFLSSAVLKPGFDNVMPALLGTMILPSLIKTPKFAILPLILATAAGVIIGRAYGLYQGYILIGIMIISVLFALLMIRKND